MLKKQERPELTGISVPGGDNVSKQSDRKPRTVAVPPHFESLIAADELVDRDFRPITWIVPGIIPAGVTLLCGSPKIGKSWLALDLALAVASGGAAFGTVACDPGAVLYLALEDNQRRLRSRLIKRLQGASAPRRLMLSTRWPRIDQGAVRELDAWLSANPDGRLVLVDTLARIRPPSRHNQTLYETDYAVGAPLLELAVRHDVGILLIHHTRKADAEDPLDLVSGTLGLSGGVDGVLVLRRDRRTQEASLFVTGRDVERDGEFALHWDPTTAGWTLTGTGPVATLSPERRAILDLVQKYGPIAGRDIAGILHPGVAISRGAKEWGRTRVLIKKLSDAGLIKAVMRDDKQGYVVSESINNTVNTVTPITRGNTVTTRVSGVTGVSEDK